MKAKNAVHGLIKLIAACPLTCTVAAWKRPISFTNERVDGMLNTTSGS